MPVTRSNGQCRRSEPYPVPEERHIQIDETAEEGRASRRPSVHAANSWLKEYISKGIAFHALPDEELRWLEEKTGMNHLQIRKWFQNKRNRMRVAGEDVPATYAANKNAFSEIYLDSHPSAGPPKPSNRRRASLEGQHAGRLALLHPMASLPSSMSLSRRCSLPGLLWPSYTSPPSRPLPPKSLHYDDDYTFPPAAPAPAPAPVSQPGDLRPLAPTPPPSLRRISPGGSGLRSPYQSPPTRLFYPITEGQIAHQPYYSAPQSSLRHTQQSSNASKSSSRSPSPSAYSYSASSSRESPPPSVEQSTSRTLPSLGCLLGSMANLETRRPSVTRSAVDLAALQRLDSMSRRGSVVD